MKDATPDKGIEFFDEFRVAVIRRMARTGMTVSELAKKTGGSRSYLSESLDGLHMPTIGWCCRVADAVDLKLAVKRKSYPRLR